MNTRSEHNKQVYGNGVAYWAARALKKVSSNEEVRIWAPGIAHKRAAQVVRRAAWAEHDVNYAPHAVWDLTGLPDSLRSGPKVR